MSSRTASRRHPGLYSYQDARGRRRWGAIAELDRDPLDGARRQKRKQGFATQDEALAWQTEIRGRRLSGGMVVASTEPLSTYLARWLANQETRVRPATLFNYRRTLKRFDVIGSVPLANVKAAAIEAIERDLLRAGYRPGTVRLAHTILSMALKDAVRLDLLPRNPCDAVDPPRLETRQPTTWDAGQMRRFLTHTAPEPFWGPLWAVLCECWLRVGELVELRWGDVDLERRTITVARTATWTAEGKEATGPAKTQSGERVIPISSGLADRLRQLRQATSSIGWVFPGGGGRRLSRNQVAAMLAASCQSAGVPILTPHEVRHSGGSIAHAAGLDIKVLSERLGHGSIAVTLKVYVHTRAEGHRALADTFAALLTEPAEGAEQQAM